jgi:hypothetical protein
MKSKLLHRPRATVKIHSGASNLIGKTKFGRVGLISKRYQGQPVKEDEVWLVDVVHEGPNYFIMIPTEKLKDATETTQNNSISD